MDCQVKSAMNCSGRSELIIKLENVSPPEFIHTCWNCVRNEETVAHEQVVLICPSEEQRQYILDCQAIVDN